MRYIDQAIRRNRRSPLLQFVARASQRYLRAWNNEDFYDFEKNGERFILDTFARWSGDRTLKVWDVGAHHGEWAQQARRSLPLAHIVSFELLPTTFEVLRAELRDEPWSTVVNLGLSDHSGTIAATFNRKFDTMSAIQPRLGMSHYNEDFLERVECEVRIGDDLVEQLGAPDLLKIDTEGHEVSVLKGLSNLLQSERAPALIQFEYGQTYLPSGSTLKQVHELLTPSGYEIGRLFPNHVDFRKYSYSLDDFRMSNFIAVRDGRLRQQLA